MTVHRFATAGPIDGASVAVAPDQIHHLRDVLRLRPGDRIIISDARGSQHAAVLEVVEPRRATARVLEPIDAPASSGVTLFQGVLKGPKMDLVVQKATELGADEIVPVVTKRTVVKIDGAAVTAKRERWRRIADEAAKQCGRAVPPAVRETAAFTDIVALLGRFDATVIFWERESAGSVRDALASIERGSEVAVFVGPEGGFEPAEVQRLQTAGAEVAGLGRLTLRSETAAIAGLAIVMHELDRREDATACPPRQ